MVLGGGSFLMSEVPLYGSKSVRCTLSSGDAVPTATFEGVQNAEAGPPQGRWTIGSLNSRLESNNNNRDNLKAHAHTGVTRDSGHTPP